MLYNPFLKCFTVIRKHIVFFVESFCCVFTNLTDLNNIFQAKNYNHQVSIFIIADLSSQVFVLIHTNYFFKELVGLEKIKYFPAEYAVSIFSLKNGIENTQNIIVSIPIPLGYKREALETSKEIHSVPVEYAGGENNFADIYAKLVGFLAPYVNEQKKYPPFYTTNENLLPVRSLLEQLCYAVSEYISVWHFSE